jgi:hypothetical protein
MAKQANSASHLVAKFGQCQTGSHKTKPTTSHAAEAGNTAGKTACICKQRIPKAKAIIWRRMLT